MHEIFPTRVVGIIAGADSQAVFRACLTAMEAGIGTVEVAMTVPDCLDVVHGLVASTGGDVPVGVGTVWEPEVVEQARASGAAFVATDGPSPEVAAACVSEGLFCAMGALTPGEIHQAIAAGAQMVRLYPVQALGGTDYIRQVQDVLAGAGVAVRGGLSLEQVPGYLAAGVHVVALDAPLFPPAAVERGDLAQITMLARRAVATVGGDRVSMPRLRT